MPKAEAKAKQLPSGNWRIQTSVTINGVLYRESFTAPTARQARADALNWQLKTKERNKPSNITLYNAVDNYIEMNRNVFSPSTIRGYSAIRRNHLEDIGNLKVSNITTELLQYKINDLSKIKSPKTVKNILYLIIPAIKQAAPDKVIKKINLPQEQTFAPKKHKKKALSHSDAKEILTKLEGENLELPVLFAAWLGLRRSEVLALEWGDIDFDKKLVHINKALVPNENNEYVLKGTKTVKSNRTLSVPDYIISKLSALERTGERIFDIPPSRLSQGFPKACKRILGEAYTFHDLRRTMASYGLAMGIDEKTMMELGGWSSVQTMRNIYQVVLEEQKETAQKKINTLFEGLISS